MGQHDLRGELENETDALGAEGEGYPADGGTSEGVVVRGYENSQRAALLF
jgi:hypothetical protein